MALVRRPSRVAQLERLLARYRWANTGLRARLAELEEDRETLLNRLTDLADDEARQIGHAHPVIVGVRRIIAEASR